MLKGKSYDRGESGTGERRTDIEGAWGAGLGSACIDSRPERLSDLSTTWFMRIPRST